MPSSIRDAMPMVPIRAIYAPLATAINHAEPAPAVPGGLRRAVSVVGDLLGIAGAILAIPLAILIVGTPLVLGVRFLLWLVGAL